MLLNARKAASQQRLPVIADTSIKILSLKVLPQNFYTTRLGYFCQKEVQVQKALRLPVYFRLGTKEYVDLMEGKNLRLPVEHH